MINITINEVANFLKNQKNRTAYCNPAEISLKGLFYEKWKLDVHVSLLVNYTKYDITNCRIMQ